MGEHAKVRVAVAGSGMLSHAVAAALHREVGVHTTDGLTARDLRPCAALVVAVDAYDTSCYSEVISTTEQTGTPWLPVRVELGTVVLGPVGMPGEPGCVLCAEFRRHEEQQKVKLLRQAGGRFADRLRTPDVWLTSAGAGLVAELVADEVRGMLAGGEACRTRNATVYLRLDTLATSTHSFLPVPSCRCGALPDDSAEAAHIELAEPRPKLGQQTYRVRDLTGAEEELTATYVDEEFGIVVSLGNDAVSPYPFASAYLRVSATGDGGYGRELSYQAARLTAITEAIERFGGSRPHGKRTAVRGSFRELSAQALNPATLGLYPEDRYALPGFPYQRYHDDLELDWVWGYSFAQAKPVLVPEGCAYYQIRHHRPGSQSFVHESSNGCAVGGCLEEAILHGILELAERDAFLLTWYGRLPVRQLDLNSARDQTLRLLVEGLEQASGMRIHVFDTTTEHGIPSVWAMAVRPGDDDRQVKALCSGGCAFDPERAIANALLELVPMTGWQPRKYLLERDRAARMVDDPDQVRTVDDHVLLYSHPRAFPWLEFLLGATDRYAISESFAGTFRPHNDDLRDDLRDTVDRYLRHGLDVVVVEQTGLEQRAGGFACAKVIIPGLLPMTFGHVNRRVDGLPRLYEVPWQLGYTDRPLRPEEINPYPHPFP